MVTNQWALWYESVDLWDVTATDRLKIAFHSYFQRHVSDEKHRSLIIISLKIFPTGAIDNVSTMDQVMAR